MACKKDKLRRSLDLTGEGVDGHCTGAGLELLDKQQTTLHQASREPSVGYQRGSRILVSGVGKREQFAKWGLTEGGLFRWTPGL